MKNYSFYRRSFIELERANWDLPLVCENAKSMHWTISEDNGHLIQLSIEYENNRWVSFNKEEGDKMPLTDKSRIAGMIGYSEQELNERDNYENKTTTNKILKWGAWGVAIASGMAGIAPLSAVAFTYAIYKSSKDE